MNHAMSIPPMQLPSVTRAHAPLSEADQAWLRAFARERGESAAALAIGLSRNTLVRARAGLGLYPGSHALIRRERHGG